MFRGFTALLQRLDDGTWGGATKTTRTERATLEFMAHLRLVLCRGAAELRPRFPDFALYKTYPFNSRLFSEWGAAASKEIIKLGANEAATKLASQACPAVVNELRGIVTKQENLVAGVSTVAVCVVLLPGAGGLSHANTLAAKVYSPPSSFAAARRPSRFPRTREHRCSSRGWSQKSRGGKGQRPRSWT